MVATLPPQHGLARRLIALGLTPGAEVCVLQNRGRGPLIVEAHGARIALGRKQADRVTIDVGPSPCATLTCPTTLRTRTGRWRPSRSAPRCS